MSWWRGRSGSIFPARIFPVGLTVALVVACGCGAARPMPVDFGEVPRNFLPRDYPEVYERWTRRARVLGSEGLLIETWATLKSWEFREAFIELYTDVYRVPPDETATLRRSELEASRGSYEFHLAAQTNDHQWNDFEKRASAWRLVLVDGAGNELQAESIELARLPDIFEARFFPYRTPFTRSYIVRFPRPASGGDFGGPETGSLTLRIAGPLGTASMIWNTR